MWPGRSEPPTQSFTPRYDTLPSSWGCHQAQIVLYLFGIFLGGICFPSGNFHQVRVGGLCLGFLTCKWSSDGSHNWGHTCYKDPRGNAHEKFQVSQQGDVTDRTWRCRPVMEREFRSLAQASGLIPLYCRRLIKWGIRDRTGLLLEFNTLITPKAKHFTKPLAPRISQNGFCSLFSVPSLPQQNDFGG